MTTAADMRQVVVVRDDSNDQRTRGRVFVDGVFFCHCLEDPIRPPGQKIKHKTAIQPGLYRLEPYASPKFGMVPHVFRETPDGKLIEPANFSFIEIHAGVTEEHSSGCLLFGFEWATNGKSLLRDRSRKACAAFLDRFLPAAKKHHVYLTIINPRGVSWPDA